MDAFLEEQSLNVVTSIPQDFKESFEEDLASHYILRLGLSKSQEFIDWFVKQEEALFLSRLRQGGADYLTMIMRTSPELSHLGKDVVSRQSNASEFESVRRCTPFPGDQAAMFYKIHFTEIPAYLIARRSVVIVKGTAYVPEKEMISLIGRKYKEYISQSMLTAARERATLINQDERIRQIADRISPAALLSSNKLSNLSPTEKLNLANFNLLLGRSIPPCMRVAIESMRPTPENRNAGKHLKNTGRNQLAPFLKTAGMSMEDSMQWWKSEFTRGNQMDSDKFDKNYTYGVKWVYGKAGRMKAAAPLSCSAVIGLEYPSHDQTHGCPFKVYDEPKIASLLRGWLTKAGVSVEDKEGRIKDIARKAAGQGMMRLFKNFYILGHEYQIACVDWFQLTHEGHSGDSVGNHPNTYFSYANKIFIHVHVF